MVKNDITDQIKNYLIDEEQKQYLLNKVIDFDKLYVPNPKTTSDTAQPPENQSETNMPAEEEERHIDSDITSEILAISSSPGKFSPPVLSTNINQIWIDDTTCHLTLIRYLNYIRIFVSQQYIVYYHTCKTHKSLVEYLKNGTDVHLRGVLESR